MHYTQVEDHANLCLRYKLIDANEHNDFIMKIYNYQKDEKELEKIFKTLPKVSDSAVMKVEMIRTANNSKLIANIMVFYLVIGILTAIILLFLG